MVKKFVVLALSIILISLDAYGLGSCEAFFSNSTDRISSKLKAAGIPFLQHLTKIDKVVYIITSGGLLTGEKVPYRQTGRVGMNRPGKVFLDTHKSTQPPPLHMEHKVSFSASFEWENGKMVSSKGDLEGAILVFDPIALDSIPFHISSNGWARYGEYNKKSDLHHSALEKADSFLKSTENDPGEIVLYDNLPIKYLRYIWIHPSHRLSLIYKLQDKGIHEINGIPLEKIIISAGDQLP